MGKEREERNMMKFKGEKEGKREKERREIKKRERERKRMII